MFKPLLLTTPIAILCAAFLLPNGNSMNAGEKSVEKTNRVYAENAHKGDKTIQLWRLEAPQGYSVTTSPAKNSGQWIQYKGEKVSLLPTVRFTSNTPGLNRVNAPHGWALTGVVNHFGGNQRHQQADFLTTVELPTVYVGPKTASL